MARQLFRGFFLSIAIALVGYGGYYIYQKQSFQIHHQSFNSFKGGATIYVPGFNQRFNATHLLETLPQFNLPGQLYEIVNPISGLNNSDLTSMQIAFDSLHYSVSFEGLSRQSFEEVFNSIAPKNDGTITIHNQSVNFLEKHNFIVISDMPIAINQDLKSHQYKGNADFFYVVNAQENAYKIKDDYLFYSDLKSTKLKGRPISPFDILSNCPLESESIKLFGSSRFVDDIQTLFSSTDPSFFNWVEDAIVFLEKDSFEVIVGNQNEYANLKHQLEESTLQQSADSLLPDKIYLNNFEIMPFKYNKDWKEIFPFLNNDLKYFSAHDNYVFLANSLPAMYWLLRELQLGNTYEKDKLSKKITSELNALRIQAYENNVSFDIEARIKSGMSIHLMSNERNAANDSLFQTSSSDFPFIKSANSIELINIDGREAILILGDQYVELYEFSGQLLWEKSFQNQIKGYKIELISKAHKIALIEGSQLHVINMNGEELAGFPYQSEELIHQLSIVKYNSENIRLLINSGGTIINIDTNGQEVEGWNKPANIGSLDSPIHYNAVHDFDFIFCTSSFDSLIVLNRRGERRFNKTHQNKLKNQSNFVSGKADIGSSRLLGYDHNHIYTQYLQTGLLDSIKLNRQVMPETVNWVRFKNKNLLCIELFDKLMLYNEFGILELEIIKPINNSKLIGIESIQNGAFIFFNLQTNKVYLLDEYGNLKRRTSLSATSIMSYNTNYFVTLINKKVVIHKL